MKILLDECVTKKLKSYLTEFEVYTVTELGWGGVKNGKLLTLCVENGFEILLTSLHLKNRYQLSNGIAYI